MANAAERVYSEICKDHETKLKAKQNEERLLELLHLEEQEQRFKDAKLQKKQTEAKLRNNLISENNQLLKFKVNPLFPISNLVFA